MTIKKYKIKNTNIIHNGELKTIGDIVELDDKTAEKLKDILTLVKESPQETKVKNQNKNDKPENKKEKEKETKTTKNEEPESIGGEKDGE